MTLDTLTHAETVELPSKGWFYPLDHPLSGGTIDIYHLTARHEDILTSRNLIQKGIVIDRLLEAVIATPGVKYEDLLLGDKNSLLISTRILGYGKEYNVSVVCPKCDKSNDEDINLELIEDRKVEFDPAQRGKNEFLFELPLSRTVVTFKLFTQRDDTVVQREIEMMAKHSGKNVTSSEVTTRMRHAILAVDGETDKEVIRKFILNMPMQDSKAFRDYARKVTPDVDFSFDFECEQCGHTERLEVPFTANFFWPNS